MPGRTSRRFISRPTLDEIELPIESALIDWERFDQLEPAHQDQIIYRFC